MTDFYVNYGVASCGRFSNNAAGLKNAANEIINGYNADLLSEDFTSEDYFKNLSVCRVGGEEHVGYYKDEKEFAENLCRSLIARAEAGSAVYLILNKKLDNIKNSEPINDLAEKVEKCLSVKKGTNFAKAIENVSKKLTSFFANLGKVDQCIENLCNLMKALSRFFNEKVTNKIHPSVKI